MSAFDPTERPTRETVEKEIIYYEKLWLPAQDEMTKADAYYFQTNNIWEDLVARLQIARPQVHLATAPGLVNHAVDAQLAFLPKWHFTPKGEGQGDKDAVDRAEGAFSELVLSAIGYGMNFPTKVNGLQLVRHNYTQISFHLNEDMLTRPVSKDGESREEFDQREEEWAAQNSDWNPLSIEVPAPGEVLMDPTRKWPKIAIRRRKLLAMDLAALVKQKSERRLRPVEILDGYEMGATDPHELIEVVERWSPRYMAMFRKKGGLIYVETNPYGFSHFAHTFGGSADMPMGEPFDPKWYVRQALLFRVMENIKLEAQATFAEHHIVMRTALAKPIYKEDPAEAAEQDKDDILTGDWSIEQVPQLAAQTQAYLQNIRDNIEFGTYSLQAAGIREAGSETATKAMILSEATNRTFKGYIKQLEGIWSIGGTMAKGCLLALFREENYGDAIKVGKSPLKVGDLERVARIEAIFEQVDVAVAMQEAAQANQDLDKERIDYDTWARIRRFEDPTGMRDGVTKDRVRRWPEIVEANGIVAAEQLGYEEIAAAREAELRKARLQRRSGGLVNPQGQVISSQPAPVSQNGRTG